MHQNPNLGNLIGVMTWPLTQGGWCDAVMTGHARVTVTWHPVTRTQCRHEYPCHWPSAIYSLSVLSCELHRAKRHDSLAWRCWVPVCPPHMWWWTLGAKVTHHHPMPRTGGGRGNWCLPWYVHTHNGAIHDGEILSRDVWTTINYHWIILAIS